MNLLTKQKQLKDIEKIIVVTKGKRWGGEYIRNMRLMAIHYYI